MANITVDIQARVVGYQKSLSDLQNQIQKLDPGASISKSVTRAFEYANNEVKGLSKNMFPKASSDTQIDAIAEKANRAGEAIQNVIHLLQQATINDLNFGSFGSDIDNFRSQIAALEQDLNTKLNQGLLSAVQGSQQLKDVFSGLGTDLDKADANTLFQDLQKGAQDAAAEVKKAQAEVDAIEKKINDTQLSLNKNKSSILATQEGRMNLDTEIKGISDSYNNIFDSLRNTMEKGLSTALKGQNIDTKGMLDTFFKDLTPENIKERIQNLFSQLSGSFNGAREFYKAVFGVDDKAGSNINNLVNSIDLRGSIDAVKAQFQEFLAQNGGLIKPDQLPKITRLIDTDSINEAVQKTIHEFDSAFGRVQKAIQEGQNKLVIQTESRDAVQKTLTEAQTRQSNYEAAITNLRAELDKVKAENEDLSKQIADLRAAMEQQKGSTLEGYKSTLGAIREDTKQNVFPLDEVNAYKQQLDQVTAKEQALGKLQGVVQHWFSIYAAIRMVRQAIDSVISTIKELDTTITEIAIVTSMDQSELWDQMPKYTQLARDYAASISGVYQVSQLYYQQGLQTADVMALTEQTLKMARISGLDYAQATDYMTNAIRSFKMEMMDAQRIVDVYSAVAAASATDTTELASAMSKTASSAQAVGSSFENTTAMMAVMIEATRESAENIGSAMKSIISRYGEMTSDPSKLVDSEGQEMSLNRVDKALQTVGISIHNAAGEFRNFDEVIMELASKWDTIDTNTQRYIATIMAGNRQQSRFLALVSSYDRLKELSAKAAESEDASQLQFLKTLDSAEAKIQQFQTSIQALYVNSGLEDFYKTILDRVNNVITSLDQLSDKSGLLASIGKISATFTSLATLVTNLFTIIKMSFSRTRAQISAEAELEAARRAAAEESATSQIISAYERENIDYQKNQQQMTEASKAEAQKRVEIAQNEVKKTQSSLLSSKTMRSKAWGIGASALGLVATTIGASMDTNTQRQEKAWTTGIGSALSGIGTGLMIGGGWGIVIGALTALPGIIEAIGISSESTEERVKKLSDAITTTNNAQLQSKNELKTLTDYKKKYDELSKAQYKSVEDKQAFIDLQNEIAASYPELISSMDSEGNYIVNMAESYQQLAEAKQEAYKEDYIKNINAELAGLSDIAYITSTYYGKSLNGSHTALEWLFRNTNNADEIYTKLAAGENINSSVNYRTAMGIFGDVIKNSNKPYEQLDAAVSTQIQRDLGNIIQQFWDAAQQGFTLPQAQNWISNQGIYDEYIEEIQSFSSEVYSKFQAEISAIKFQKKRITAYFDKAISDWLNILSDTGLIEDTDFQQAIVALRVQDAWSQYQKDAEDGTVTLLDGTTKNVKKIGQSYTNSEGKQATWSLGDQYNEFISQYTASWYAATIEQLDYLQTNSIDELYANRGQYTQDQIKSIPAYQKLGEATEEFWRLYDEAYKDVFERYEHFLQEDVSFIGNDELQQTLANFKDLIGPDFLQGIIDQYRKILDNTDLTQSEQAGQIDTLTAAIDSLRNLSGEDQIKAFATLQTADLTSLFGIYKFIEDLNKKDINLDGTGIIEAFRLFSHTLTINLESELNSYGETISQISEDYNKDLSDATKGMDLKKASEMSKKFNISLTDFDYSNNKFFLSNLDTIRSYYLDQYQAYTDALQVEFDQQVEGYKKLEGITWNYHLRTFNWNDVFNKGFTLEELDKKFADLPDMQQHFKEQTGFEYSDFRNLYEEFLGQNETDNFFTFLETYYFDQFKIYSDYFKDLEKDALKNAAKNALSIGDIDKFADIIFDGQEQKQSLTKFLLGAFKEGDLNNILQFVPAEYAQMVADTFKDSIKSVYDAFSLDGGIGKLVTSDALNASTLASLELDGLVTRFSEENGNIIYQLATITEENIDTYIKAIKNDANLTSTEKASKLSEAHNFKYKDKVSALTTALSDQTIDYSAAQDLAEALGYTADQAKQAMSELGFVLNTATGKWRRGAQTLEKIKARITELEGSASLEDLNELYALEDVAENYEISEQTDALSEILSNYQSVGPEALARLASAFGASYNDIKAKIATDNGDGTYQLNIDKIPILLEELNGEVSQATIEAIEKAISSIGDSFLANIKNVTSYTTKGASSLADVETFKRSYADIVGETLDADAFNYNSVLQSFILDESYMDEYINAQREKLQQLGYTETFIDQYIKDQTDRAIQDNITLDGFLNATTSAERTNEANKFFQQIQGLSNYYDIEEYAANLYFGKAVDSAEEGFKAIIAILDKGGQDAVDLFKQIKPEASSEELEAVYNNQINKLNDVISQVGDLAAGQFVGTEGKLYEVLSRAKAIDNNGVVQAGFSMVEVYAAIYDEMSNTAGATTADLNNAYAKLLTARDQKNIDTIDALENAANMSFDALAQLFNNQGRNLEKELPELLKTNTIGLTGFGGIRIFDFKAFAGKLGILENTPEYYEAYNTYADSMAEFYNSTNNIIDNVAEQIKGLADAKPGKAINVSYLQQILGNKFSEAIEGYGHMVQDGIMVLNQGADIPGLITAVANKAAEAGQILPEQLAELADAVADVLSQMTSLITGGISGDLSHADKYNLIEQAKSRLGITDLEFTQTADGFKLVESSAIRLYQALKSIDSLQAGKVFEALRESLEGSNENFKTVEALTAHIANLTKQINTEDQKVSSNRLEQYKAELEVAKEILAVRSTTEDSSFKFMEQDIPSGQNNPLNYWSNWQTAFEAINESKGTGKMDYKDFYNLMTEMANLSDMMGGKGIQIGKDLKVSSETVADLITQAGANLEVAADGSLKVNLSGIGVDFAASAKDMQTGVDAGIDALAQSQIDMLDSMIQLLETIVAMEKLSDIDVEGKGIDLGEMFEMNGENLLIDDQGFVQWKEGMKDAASKILSMADDLGKDSDLYKGLDNVKANGVSLRQMLIDAKNGAKLTENEAKLYHATIAAFYKAMLSGDYNEDDIMASIKEVLSSTSYDGEIEVGDMHLVLKHGYVLERDSKGKFIVGDKKFDDEQKALNALAADELQDLLGKNKEIDAETGTVTYHGPIDAIVEVDVKTNTYTAHVGDYTVTSNSKEGIAAAIKTAALLNDKEWEGGTAGQTEAKPVSFTVSQEGVAIIDVTVDTELGKVTFNPTEVQNDGQQFDNLYGKLTSQSNQILDITQNVVTGENEVADSITDNQTEGENNSVNQDITNNVNETGDALTENAAMAAEGIAQEIEARNEEVKAAIKDNQAYAAANSAVQTLKVNKVTVEDSEGGTIAATGNIGLAHAKGTLMGELGPELVVSNGRYFVAGQNGAEMVDLADDAIVFNHLQTEQLLKHGMSSGRGRAVTNERNAVAFATGNVEGPAMASASAALNALKQLRAMWQSLLSASVSDLAGGGGGGGGGGGDKIVDPRAWIDTVERWYNLTQKIDLLEKDITHQQQLREKINSDFQKSGTAYYNSQRQSLKDLQEEIAAQEQLNISRQEYLNARVEALRKTPLGNIYSMDENGQFSWNDNTNFRVNGRTIKGGHDFLENLYGFDSQKGANYTNKQKYDILIANGFADYMRTSANGEAIKADSDNDGQISEEEWESYYEAATEAFRDKMDEYKETTQDLADKVQEGKDEILKQQQAANELMREMRDNQIAVEDNVLKAIEESRQREIDKLQDLRDAIEDSNQAYLDGLNKALENERDLYSQNENADELNRLRRQRDILARSGGSASQIAQLNDEIAQKTQDAYFEAQQQQIDALQEASDLQLERLDNQIDIMTQTLEYQKEFGLLWGEVYNVMAKSPAEIAAFLAENTSEYWAQSPVKDEDTFRDWLFTAEQWTGFRDDLSNTESTVSKMYDLNYSQQKEADYKTFNDQMVALHGANYDSSGKYKQAFYEEYDRSHDISKATQVAQSAYTADENAKKAAAAAAQARVQQQVVVNSGGSTSSAGNSATWVKYSNWESNDAYHWRYSIYSDGRKQKVNYGAHSFTQNNGANKICSVCGKQVPFTAEERKKLNSSTNVTKTTTIDSTQYKKLTLQEKRSGFGDPTKAAGGGYVNHGLYELGERGTETVFTASQTKILRDNILSNRPSSLISLLRSYNENYDNINSPLNKVTTAEDNSVNIERVEMTMQVQQLANDYDARRAGDQALSEILRIARKTSANNSIRR